jgi:hypothetical protein
MSPRQLSLAVCVGLALVLALAGVAQADILAAVEVPSPSGGDLDIALVNATLGTRLTLPAGINTAADELHPSLSADGTRVVFERRDETAGTERIIEAKLATGQQADLFNAFEASSRPQTPFLGATTVLTGRPLGHYTSAPATRVQPALNTVNVTSFPSPPFTKGLLVSPSTTLSEAGRTISPVQDVHGTVAYAARLDDGSRTSLVLVEFGGSEAGILESGTAVNHPALGSGVIAFERRPITATGVGPGSLAWRPLNVQLAGARSTPFPANVNAAGLDESRPAFTADGRYLAFVRHGSDDHDRLLLFDTQTQTIVNPAGIDLGGGPINGGIGQIRRIEGNVSLFQRFVLVASSVSTAGLVTVQLLQASGVGILVQRVVGHHHLLRRRVPTLKLVGRVPFGRKRKGHDRIHWNRRVNGHRLRPGTYLITPRAVSSKGVVRELGRPRTIRIRRRG